MDPEKNQKIQTDPFQKLAVFLFIAVIILILPVLFFVTGYFKSSQDIRSKAAGSHTVPSPGKIFYTEFSYSTGSTGALTFTVYTPQIRNGFPAPLKTEGGTAYNAILLDANHHTIASYPFDLPRIAAADGIDTTSGKKVGKFVKVASSHYGLALPYDSTAASMKITDSTGTVVANFSLTSCSNQNNFVDLQPVWGDDYPSVTPRAFLPDFHPKKAFAANGVFSVAVIGDNYSGNTTLFQKDVADLINGILSVEPFATNKASIVFYPALSTTAICVPVSGWPSIKCDDGDALAQASGLPYDKVYVLYNGPYTGYAYVGGTLSYGTSSTDQTLAVKQGLFIHEMAGHALGALMDEYSYGTTGASYGPNCASTADCPAWQGVSGLGCFATCGYTNLFRATDNGSVMNLAYFNGFIAFDQFSTELVQNKLSQFIAIPTPIGPNPASPTPLPSATPVVLPTITPRPLISPTPSPQIFPTPTLVIIPSATPVVLPPTVTVVPGQPTPTTFAVPLPTDTLSPTLTSVPTAVPTPTRQIFPTATPVFQTAVISPTSPPSVFPPTQPPLSYCSLPNYCTETEFCDGTRAVSGNCGVSGWTCCSIQSIFEPPPPVTAQSVNTSNPFSDQFEPLPTLVINISNPLQAVSASVTPQEIASAITPTPTAYQYTVRTESPSETPATATTNPVYVNPFKNQYPTPTAPTVRQISPAVPTLVHWGNTKSVLSPTPPEIEFERPTPTPTPPVSIIGRAVDFVSSLVRGIFSVFLGK